MKAQRRAFVLSLAIHLAAGVLTLGIIMGGTTPAKKPVIIDFSLDYGSEMLQSSRPSIGTGFKAGSPGGYRPALLKGGEQSAPPTEGFVGDRTSRTELASAKNRAEVDMPESPRHPYSGPCDGIRGDSSGGKDSGSSPGTSAIGGGGHESSGDASLRTRTERAEMRYMKAHFAAIRNTIVDNLSYPGVARRMGWSGTVKVSFVISEDGSVGNVRILAASGYAVLDHEATETVRRCSPYPKPPVAAEIVMPITYRLNE